MPTILGFSTQNYPFSKQSDSRNAALKSGDSGLR